MKQVEKFVVANVDGVNHVYRFKSFSRPWLYNDDVLYGIEYLGLESQQGEPLHILTMDTVDKTINYLNDIHLPIWVLRDFISFVSLFTCKDVEGNEFKIEDAMDDDYNTIRLFSNGFDVTHILSSGVKETYAYTICFIEDYV